MELRQERRKWTEREDAILKKEVGLQREKSPLINWAAVSENLPNRTNKDCRKRWLKSGSYCRKGTWTEDEDERLIKAVKAYGTKWTQAASYVGTRNADQCAKRWQHSLDPNVNRSEWTQEEDDALYIAVSEEGRNWRHIANTIIPGRSTTHLKNRYELICRRRQEQEESIYGDIDFHEDGIGSPDTSSTNDASSRSDFPNQDPPLQSNYPDPCMLPTPPELNSLNGFENIPIGLTPTNYDGELTAPNNLITDKLNTDLGLGNNFSTSLDDWLTNPYTPPESLWSAQGSDQMILDTNCYDGGDNIPQGVPSYFSPPKTATPSNSIQNGSDGGATNCTIKLEDIDVGTVRLICDMLMEKHIRFDMHLHRNNG